MTHPNPQSTHVTQFEQWQAEQKKWQQVLQSYIDRAAQDEEFLTHIGNAMRGSLLAGKPYPGSTTPVAEPTAAEATQSTLEELLFAVRRLEAQLNELTLEIWSLRSATTAPAVPADIGDNSEIPAGQHDPADNTTE